MMLLQSFWASKIKISIGTLVRPSLLLSDHSNNKIFPRTLPLGEGISDILERTIRGICSQRKNLSFTERFITCLRLFPERLEWRQWCVVTIPCPGWWTMLLFKHCAPARTLTWTCGRPQVLFFLLIVAKWNKSFFSFHINLALLITYGWQVDKSCLLWYAGNRLFLTLVTEQYTKFNG